MPKERTHLCHQLNAKVIFVCSKCVRTYRSIHAFLVSRFLSSNVQLLDVFKKTKYTSFKLLKRLSRRWPTMLHLGKMSKDGLTATALMVITFHKCCVIFLATLGTRSVQRMQPKW